ncbi:prepilin peptidase [Arthrobacter glacialis]|uniref:Prepilin peptidase n=1 Tax=Arthrobacter glacialis TaxID=1664 RepID=A0A2S4A0M6_ARTGL|nr:A24 family peptidase [Arthrobacter glacialis]POH60752.1 prepilin peptidase [Arthrobacter glacialis]POH74819.1 prepilin peptidase [Arthrobacter glacialis]
MVTRLSDLLETSLAAFLAVLAACLYLLWLAVVLSVIDIRTHKLPNRYVLPAYPVAAVLLLGAALAAGMPQLVISAVGGALAAGALYWLLWALYPAGMGFGDVKLAGVLGMFLGFLSWQHVWLGLGAGFVVGGLWGVAVIVSRRGTAKSAIPFGPSMLAGALATLLLVPA